jgi:Domain of unknown function (DUF1844)
MDLMAEEKHDAGFKVVDRRSFATETASRATATDTASRPAVQPSSAEPPKVERPPQSAHPDLGRDTSPRIEIPGGEEDLDFEPGAQPYSGFDKLVSYLGTTTMFQLGLMAGPSGERIPADLANARQTIDMLEVLQDKTRGNLTSDEGRLLEDVLYELRMAYVEVDKHSRPK